MSSAARKNLPTPTASPVSATALQTTRRTKLTFQPAQCPAEHCNGDRAYFFQLQIRSADEPMTTFLKVSSLHPAFGRMTDSWASVRRVVHGGGKIEEPCSLLIATGGVFQVENGAFTSYGVLEKFTEPVQIPNPKIDLRQGDPARTGSFRLACPAAEKRKRKRKAKREKIGLDTTTGLLRVIVLPSYHASGIEGVLLSPLSITKYNNRLPGYNSSSWKVAKSPMHDTVEIFSGS